jgi:hypothetical protein
LLFFGLKSGLGGDTIHAIRFKKKLKSEMCKSGEFVIKTGLEKYNLRELMTWVNDVSLNRKLLGVSTNFTQKTKVSAVNFMKSVESNE